jgi:hypothetical protein
MRLSINARLKIFVVRYGWRTTKKKQQTAAPSRRHPTFLGDGVQHPLPCVGVETHSKQTKKRKKQHRDGPAAGWPPPRRGRAAEDATGLHRTVGGGGGVAPWGDGSAQLWGKDPAPPHHRIRTRLLKEHNPSPPWGARRRGARTAAEGSAPPWSSDHRRLIQELGSAPPRAAVGSAPP